MRFIAIIILAMPVFDLLFWWRADRQIRQVCRERDRMRRAWRVALAAFMLVQLSVVCVMLAGRSTATRPDEFLPRVIVVAAYVWHLPVMPMIIIPWSVAGVATRIVRGSRSKTSSSQSAPPGDSHFSRRDLLNLAVVASGPLICGGTTLAALRQLNTFRVRRLTLDLPTLPREWDGLTIAHVSDTHIGSFTNERVTNAIAEQTNALRPDLVCFPGDLINFSLGDLPAGVDFLRRLRAPLGVYVCEGNHDLIESRAGFERGIRAAGLNFLLNESAFVTVGSSTLQLLGLRWGSIVQPASTRLNRTDAPISASMNELTPQLREGAWPILLAHHPHAFDFAADAGIPLTLAGHTHGGQLMASPNIGFGPLMFRYWSGVYRKPDGAALVVSNGVGNWFPLRVNAPAEIVHLTLRRAM